MIRPFSQSPTLSLILDVLSAILLKLYRHRNAALEIETNLTVAGVLEQFLLTPEHLPMLVLQARQNF